MLPIDALRMRNPSGGGGGLPGFVRGSRVSQVNNSSGIAYSFPTGSQAGDLCVIGTAHYWGVNTPSGWTSLDNQTGSFVNGAIIYKVLSSGDISTGTVTILYTNGGWGVVCGITFVGSPTSIRTSAATRNGSFGATRTVTTDSSPQASDYAMYFGICRGNTTASCNVGTQLGATSGTDNSGVLSADTVSSGGAQSATYSYGTSSGDYQGIIIVQP